MAEKKIAMSEPQIEVKHLCDVLKVEAEKLTIPDYQRPYKWDTAKVIQLLNDLNEHIWKKTYRIGSIILHDDTKHRNIVYGQQRLTTLAILLHFLGETGKLLHNVQFSHAISKDNIRANHLAIKQWFQGRDEVWKQQFKLKLLANCEIVLFTVCNQEEAFQLFDSQNARGMPLEPYDLLKAFHLREMENDTEEERKQVVACWEEAISNHTLKPVLAERLFRIRRWSSNQKSYDFTKDDISEFKGISLRQAAGYPHEQPTRLLAAMITDARNNRLMQAMGASIQYPFAITMPIVNGRLFFDYVQYYIRNWTQLRQYILEPGNKLTPDYNAYCLKYPGAWRAGDQKVRNLFENMLLLFIDRFGYTPDLPAFYKAYFKAAYYIRLESMRVSQSSIVNSTARQWMQTINEAAAPERLNAQLHHPYKEITGQTVAGIDEIKKAFLDHENSHQH